jgi:hypothetical protein
MVAIITRSLLLSGLVGVSGVAFSLGTAVAANPAATPNPKRHGYQRPDRDERDFPGRSAGCMSRLSACSGLCWSQA